MESKGLILALILLTLTSTVISQSFTQRSLNVKQTEYDLFKTSSLTVTCDDFFCERPYFTLTETVRPWFNQSVYEEIAKDDYITQCELIKKILLRKEVVDWQYADYKSAAEAFMKTDCAKEAADLKAQFQTELYAVPQLSTSTQLTLYEVPDKPIIDTSTVIDVKRTTTTTTLKEIPKETTTSTTLKEKEPTTTTLPKTGGTGDTSASVKDYYPETISWQGRIDLVDNQGEITVGSYTNSYNIIVNFSSASTCNMTFRSTTGEKLTSCYVLLNKNATVVNASMNITGKEKKSLDYYNIGAELENTYFAPQVWLGEASTPVNVYINTSFIEYRSSYTVNIRNITMNLTKNNAPTTLPSNLTVSVYNLTSCTASMTPSTCNFGTSNLLGIVVSNLSYSSIVQVGGMYTLRFNKTIPLIKDRCYAIRFDQTGQGTNGDYVSDRFNVYMTYNTSGVQTLRQYYSDGSSASSTRYVWVLSRNYGSFNATNVTLDINTDNINEYNHTNQMIKSIKVNNLQTSFNNCTDVEGFCNGNNICSCPISVYSKRGFLSLSNLNVTYNTPPIAVSVSINNTPLIPYTKNATCTCGCWDYDGNTCVTNKTWWVNGTQKNYNVTRLHSGNYTNNDTLICGCQCSDSFACGDWANSSAVTVGETNPPSVTNYGISDPSIYIGSTVTLSSTVTDDHTISFVYYEMDNGVGSRSNYTATPSGSLYSYILTPGTTGTWDWTAIYARDQLGFMRIADPNITVEVSTAPQGANPPAGAPPATLPSNITIQPSGTFLDFRIIQPQTVGPNNQDHAGYPGTQFTNVLIVENRLSTPLRFDTNTACVENSTHCMISWCSWKNQTELNFTSTQSFLLSVKEGGQFYAVLGCDIPLSAEIGSVYDGELLVRGCTTELCYTKRIPMLARVTEAVPIFPQMQDFLHTPMMFSVAGECSGIFCYNLQGDTITTDYFTFTGLRLWHILSAILIISFIVTAAWASKSGSSPAIGGILLMCELMLLSIVIYLGAF